MRNSHFVKLPKLPETSGSDFYAGDSGRCHSSSRQGLRLAHVDRIHHYDSLLGRGANRGVCGSDITIISHTNWFINLIKIIINSGKP